MQDIEKDMDDLFRKAGDNYQPKPGESNWEKIEPRLLATPVVPAAMKKENNTKRYFMLLFLLLFLLISGLLTKYIVGKNTTTVSHKPLANGINNPGEEQGKFDKEIATEYEKASEEKRSILKTEATAAQNHEGIKKSLLIKKPKFNNDTIEVINEIRNTDVVLFSNDVSNEKASTIIGQYATTKIVKGFSGFEERARSDSREKVEIKVNPQQNQHGFYFGGAIGISFNSVKYQSFGKPGFDIGVIAGYKGSKKVSIESGLFFGKKYYFTDGKYFSMDKVGPSMPPEMKIVSLKGSSTLFEIPVKFKYDILFKDRSAMFASAGVSSYVLTNEKNNYITSMNGTTENITGSYKNSSRYFAAAIDFSLGYEYRLSNNKSMRIEPYLQVPLKGIGMGTLPVMSAGLQVGFTVFPH